MTRQAVATGKARAGHPMHLVAGRAMAGMATARLPEPRIPATGARTACG